MSILQRHVWQLFSVLQTNAGAGVQINLCSLTLVTGSDWAGASSYLHGLLKMLRQHRLSLLEVSPIRAARGVGAGSDHCM